MKHSELSKLAELTTFIFDVDGVLTDGSVLVNERGEELRTMSIRDGFALQYAVKQSYRIFIITGGHSEGVILRLKKLGIYEIYSGVEDKRKCLEEMIRDHKLDAEKCLYMGDDIPDLEAMSICGFKACPADAAWEIKELADIICENSGGRGCVRELIRMVLSLQDKWPT